jgi:hypothetical protein
MSAHSVASVTGCIVLPGSLKIVSMAVTLTSSYDTGGSVLDLSTANATLGTAHGFTAVQAVLMGGVTTAADSKYVLNYVRAASGAAATGLIKIHDSSQAADAEATSTADLDASTVHIVVIGK